MVSKYDLYRAIAPFRSKTQLGLRDSRKKESLESFTRSFEQGPLREVVALFLWNYLREFALVPDFKPSVNDSFSKVYGLHTDELVDDVLDPITTKCSIDVSGMSFKGYDLSTIDTPADVNRFVMELASKSANPARLSQRTPKSD
jgi:hypothetical protein